MEVKNGVSFPTLYKATSTGALQFWDIFVGYAPDSVQPYPEIITRFGQLGTGNPQQTSDVIREGKNVGKKNATTPYEQACFEAKAKWEKMCKKGYVTDSARAEAKENDLRGVPAMLAHKYSEHSEKIVFPAAVQPKLDGIRCLTRADGTLWSRSQKPITSVPHIQAALLPRWEGLPDLDPTQPPLDGELFHDGVNLHRLESLKSVCIAVKDQEVLLDEEDFPKLQGRTICLSGNGYPVVRIEQKNYYVHRLVMGSPPEDIDHKNGNKLDSRKRNLRLVTESENGANAKTRKDSTSNFKGVHFFERDKTWQAQITQNYEKIHVGYFSSAEDAARAYDSKAKELFGRFAKLNFTEAEVAVSFEKIISIVRQTKGEHPEHQLVQYHVYDLAIPEMPFSERMLLLRACVDALGPDSPIKLVETRTVNNHEELMTAFRYFRSLGYEGAMVRNLNSPYEGKRSYHLQKVKEFDEAEFRIIGVLEGRGKLQGHVGSFTCVTADGEEFEAKMEGELSNLKTLFENPTLWQGRLLTVQYQGLTTKNKVPRFPVGLRFREEGL